MIAFIIKVRAALWAQGKATITPSAMGNPTSQARHIARLRDLNGALWPFVHLEPGKRGRYKLDVVEITGWDAVAHCRIDEFGEIAELPSRLWLFVHHLQLIGRPHAEPECTSGALVWLTHHALSRLCQRCNARDPRDLIVATHGLIDAICKAETDGTMPRPVTNPAGHRLCVELGGDLGDCIAVLERHDSLLEQVAPVVVTILPPDAEAV
jgi:hypothetical protein